MGTHRGQRSGQLLGDLLEDISASDALDEDNVILPHKTEVQVVRKTCISLVVGQFVRFDIKSVGPISFFGFQNNISIYFIPSGHERHKWDPKDQRILKCFKAKLAFTTAVKS